MSRAERVLQAMLNDLTREIRFRNWSMGTAARNCDLSLTTVHRWLTGDGLPTLPGFIQLAQGLGYEITLTRKELPADDQFRKHPIP